MVIPLDHTLVRRLLPDYIERVREAERKLSDLDARIAEAQQSDDEDSEEDDDSAIGPDELKSLKKKARESKKALRKLKSQLAARLKEARDQISAQECQDTALLIFRAKLTEEMERYVGSERRVLLYALHNWWEKYGISLNALEERRLSAQNAVSASLGRLGYVA